MKMQWVCHDHCDGIAGGYPSFKIGGVTMQQATSKWWRSSGGDPAAAHTRLPCRYALSSPHKCNPSCFDGR